MPFVEPYKDIHITRKRLGKRARLKASGDYEPKGVSFSPSERQALNAIPLFYTGKDNFRFTKKDYKKGRKIRRFVFNIYTPVRKRKAIVPKKAGDYWKSGEKRVAGTVPVKRIGRMRVESSESRDGKNIYGMRILKKEVS
jgi:hypothetical protein